MQPQPLSPASHQQAQLFKSLREVFGDFDATLLETMLPLLEWVEVHGGEVLIHEGATDDDLYFLISGRLRASIRTETEQKVVGEVVRGETIGEMTIFTGDPRSATVTAIRDSVLARMSRQVFQTLLQQYPMLSINLTRLIIRRLKRSNDPRLLTRRPVNICLAPITADVDVVTFGATLVDKLRAFGAAVLITPNLIAAELADHRLASTDSVLSSDDTRRLSQWLEALEARHDFLVFYTDGAADSEWNRRSLRYSDEVLLLANAEAPVALHPLETTFLSVTPSGAGASQVLVLLHDAEKTMPAQTAAWLNRRPLTRHIHIRPRLERDMKRLARIQSGHAIGLVFCGGGARGFAHLGVYKALHEYGIQVDYVGGTSIGAVMGAFAAFDLPPDVMLERAGAAFARNPTSDFSLLPLISLIGGRKLKSVIDGAVRAAVGFDADIEDCWKNFFCVASNYSKAREHLLFRGNLAKAVRASVSIPGALPPVFLEGDVLMDGGTFNNFPTDVMARQGVGKIVGVDLMQLKEQRQDLDEVPGLLALLQDKFRPVHNRKYQLPSLPATLLRATSLYSVSRQKEARNLTDLCFNPDLRGVGMLDWRKFDHAVDIGYQHAKSVLAAMTSEQLAPFR